MRQPALKNTFGCKFFGKAETATGDIWWYIDVDGRRRIPLLPVVVDASVPADELQFRGSTGRVVGRVINLGSSDETGGTSSGTSTGGMHGRTNGDG